MCSDKNRLISPTVENLSVTVFANAGSMIRKGAVKARACAGKVWGCPFAWTCGIALVGVTNVRKYVLIVYVWGLSLRVYTYIRAS